MPDTKHVIASGNITRVILLDFSDADSPYIDANGDFVDENGFFIRAETEGYVKYCPVGNNADAEAIEKNFPASTIFIDPEVCRKVFHELNAGGQRTMAENIYIGWGV